MSVVIEKSMLIEKVCEKCPATRWGQKAICSVHNLHIGKIERCPEWEKYMVEYQGLKDHDGQIAFIDLEPALEWLQQADETIKGYRYLIARAAQLRSEIDKDEYVGLHGPIERLVAQYGVEATLPKPKGNKPAALLISEELFERKIKRLCELERKIEEVEVAARTIHDVQEQAVLECLLEGESLTTAALLIGVSRTTADKIKRSIIKKLAWELYGPKTENLPIAR